MNNAFTQSQTQEKVNEKKEMDERVRNTLKENAKTIRFMENKGQLGNKDVLYYFESSNGSVYIERGRIRFVALKDTLVEEHEHEAYEDHDADQPHEEEEEEEEEEMEPMITGTHTFSLYMEGSNPTPGIKLGDAFATKFNYFLGTDPTNWASGVRAAKDLTLEDVYPGIDLRLYSNADGSMEFDWVMDPGADYNKVKLHFEGQDLLSVDQDGSLRVGLRFADIKFDIPESYQVTENGKAGVDFAFSKTSENTIGFITNSVIDPRYPVVIDPVLKWGTFVDANLAAFDAYLFATQVDPNDGMVYCAGGSNQSFPTGAAPYDANGYLNSITFTNQTQGATAYPTAAVVYRINNSGTDLVDYTLYGPGSLNGTNSPFIVAQALSLSANAVFVGGVTNTDIPIPAAPPSLATAFDNSRSSGDGFVLVFSRDLGTLNYATYLGGTGNEVVGVTSLRATADNAYTVGMTVNAALPAGYISAGVAQTGFGGGTDMYIAKFNSYNTLAWGTYVGGAGNETFNDLELFGDGRVAFAGFGTGQLTEVNSAAGRSTGTDNDGILGVLKTNGLTPFNYLDELGSTGDDRIFDAELVGTTIYWTGAVSTGFPTSAGAFDVSHNGSTDIIVGKVGDTGGAGAYAATFYGTASEDLGNGIKLVTTTNCAGVQTNFLLVFGTVGGTGLSTQNLNGETFFNASFTAGGNSGFDMFFAGFNNDLTSRIYGTYLGGNADDYLGSTGEPRGSNHLWVNNTDVYLGTTTHSASHTPTLVANGFDTGKSNGTNDAHLIISVSFNSIVESDYGDAPATYGAPSHSLDCTHLKIGTLIDTEGASAPSSLANGDDNATSDDEDGISIVPSFADGGPQSVSVTVNNLNNTIGSTANLYGWIDFNGNGTFEATEFASNTVPTGSVNVSRTLTWPTATVGGGAASHYLRIRMTTNTLNDVAGGVDDRSVATASNGEVEDYRAISLTCPSNKTVSCMTQAQVDADYAAWLLTVKSGGGCNDGTTTNNSTGAPNFCGGTKTVTFTYTSQCAPLTTTCMATYTVLANTSPVITTCAAARIIDGCNTAAITNPAFSATTVASTEAIFEGAPNNGNTSDACAITAVTYKDVAAGTCPIIVTRTWTISDACGSSATCNQTITVRDITSPLISTCAVARIIDGCNTGAITNPAFSSTIAASTEAVFESAPNNGVTSDNCSAVSVNYFDVASGTCPIVVTRRWIVSDACGNTSTCNQTITVRDITSPLISTCAAARIIDGCNTGAITNPAFSTVTVVSTEAVFESAPNNGNTSDNCTAPVNVSYIDVAAGTCPIVVTRRWTVSDACGNTATCNQTITVRDITPPVNTPGTIAACYPSVAAAQAAATAATTATDNCSAVTETVGTTGTCNAVVTVTETDACGNSSSTVYNTSIDNAGPSIVTCAVARTIDGCSTAAITSPGFSTTTTASSEAVFEASPNNGNTSDNCAISSVTYSDVATGTCPIVVTRRWTVSDVCGNTSTCNQTITVRDITSPVITTCAVARIIDGCNTGVITNPAFSTVTAASTEAVFESAPNNGNSSDNCTAPVNVSYIDVAAGTCPIVVTRRWTVSDACGNTATCNQTITVRDITPPVNTPGTIASCYPTVAAAQAAATAATTATDNCSAVTETVGTVGTCNAVVTVTETDACGNSSSTVYNTSIDNAGPSIVTCAVARTIDGCSTAAITSPGFSTTTTASTEAVFEASPNNGNTLDNCAISSVTYSDVATGTCPIVVTRRWTVSDVCGNTSTCNQTITVRDITPPVNTPGTIAACFQTVAAAEAAALAATSATDNCSGVTESVSTVGTCSAVVTVTETDACGNSSSTIYNTRIDNTPPGIISGTIATCYPNVAAAEAAALAATSATDNCSGPITETVSTVGTCNATVTVTETDGCNNSSTKVYTTSIDPTAPTIITCAIARIIDGCTTAAITTPGFSSTVTTTTEAVFESSPNNGNTSDNCGITSVTYSDVAVGSCPIVVTRRWTISDACGNTSTCNQTITVRDITPPICQTQNITVSVNPLTGLANITAAQVNNGSMDACSSVTLGVSPSNFSCSNTGPNVVVLTVTDACLNSSTCTATVTITGCADLSLTKTVSYNSMTNVATFTVIVTNNGPSPATGIEATDQLPSGYTYVSNSPTQGSYNNVSGVWLVGNLGVGASATLLLNATVNAGLGLNYLNKAQITEDQQYDPDSDPETNDTVDDLNDGIQDDDEASASLNTADLSLTKTAGVYNSLTNSVVFTITVLNSGPTTATNVQVTDQLPNAYNFVSSVASQGSYNNVSGIWNIGTMPNGSSFTLTITVTVNTGIGLIFTNAAQVTHSDQLDPDSNPNTGPTTDEDGDGNGDDDDEDNATPVIADLSLTKTAGIFNSANNQLTFTITILNSGPNDATNVQVTDQLPNAYTYVSNTATPGTSYNNVSGLWTIGSIVNGASKTLTITVTVNTGNGLIYTNAAQVTNSDQIDPDSSPDTGPTVDENGDGNGDDDDEDNATPVIADLSLTKTAGIFNSANNQLTFTITILNSGPNDATNVQVTDQLPNAYTYVSNTATPGTSYNNVSGLWTIGSIANGASKTLTITVTVNTGNGLIYTNAAQVTNSDQIDPDSSPDTGPTVDENGDGNGDDDDEDNAKPLIADLSLTKTAGIYNATLNQLVFTITVLNSGPDGATNVKVTDQLPTGFTYLSRSPSQGTYNNVSGLWTIGSMANGASVTLAITVKLNTGIGLVYTNAAQVTDSDQIDPDSSPDTGPTVDEDGDTNGDDDDEDNVTVQLADLSLTKTVNDNTPDQNSNITYTITVTNSGPNNATGVVVKDILPAGVLYVSNIPSVGSYNNITGLWTVGPLAVGVSQTLTIVATVTGSGVITNNAEITNADQADPDSDPASSFNQDDHGDGVPDDDEANVPITVNCGNCNVINGPTGPVCPGTTSTFNAQIVGLCSNPVYHWSVTGNFISFVPNGSTVMVTAGNVCGQPYTVSVSIDCQSCGTSPIVCMTSVLVQDAIPPVIITCAAPRNIQGCNTSSITDPPFSTTVATSSEAVFENAINNGNATDGCGIASVTYFDVAAGVCPTVITRRWTVNDGCGNSATCIQTINVNDTTPPVISACAVTRTFEGCNTGVITAPPFSTVTVIVPESVFENAPNNGNTSDNCGVAFVSYRDVATGTCPIVVTRRWTVSDACGNTSTCNQTINVNDTTPPAFTSCPGNSTINCPATPVFGTPSATDACDPSLLITPVDVTIAGTCPGRYSVVRTWTATDDCGNTATCSSTITVQDNTVPQITCPPTLVLNCDAGVNYVAIINAWIATATATDVCDMSVAITTNYDGMSIPNFSCQGGMPITFTATDDCGNTATCIATVTKPCFNMESWVYLEGAAANPAGGATYTLPMRTTLNDLRVLPGQLLVDPFFGNKYSPPGQPYNIAPWNYFGNEGNLFDSGGNPNNSTAGYPSTVVDWILVSLRLDSAGTVGPICQTAALVHKDGTIQFVKPLNCCGVSEGTSYYVVIEHRNHLIVMSNVKVSFINHKLLYDFRLEQSWEDPVFAGLNLFAREKEILPGKFAMYAGNGSQSISLNADTDVNFDDRSFWESQNGAVGFYRIGDYNLNADTNFNDRIVWERNNGKFTSVPRN